MLRNGLAGLGNGSRTICNIFYILKCNIFGFIYISAGLNFYAFYLFEAGLRFLTY